MQANIRFNPQSGRYQVGTWELHCGDCFQVLHKGTWADVRIEHTRGDWYLVQFPHLELEGLQARTYSE